MVDRSVHSIHLIAGGWLDLLRSFNPQSFSYFHPFSWTGSDTKRRDDGGSCEACQSFRSRSRPRESQEPANAEQKESRYRHRALFTWYFLSNEQRPIFFTLYLWLVERKKKITWNTFLLSSGRSRSLHLWTACLSILLRAVAYQMSCCTCPRVWGYLSPFATSSAASFWGHCCTVINVPFITNTHKWCAADIMYCTHHILV